MAIRLHFADPTLTPAGSERSHALPTGVELHRHLSRPAGLDGVPRQRLVPHTGNVFSTFLGPAVTAPGRRWWTFLTSSYPRTTGELPAKVRAVKMHSGTRGGHVPVSSSGDSQCWWQHSRRPRALPHWPAVVTLTRKVLMQRQ